MRGLNCSQIEHHLTLNGIIVNLSQHLDFLINFLGTHGVPLPQGEGRVPTRKKKCSLGGILTTIFLSNYTNLQKWWSNGGQIRTCLKSLRKQQKWCSTPNLKLNTILHKIRYLHDLVFKWCSIGNLAMHSSKLQPQHHTSPSKSLYQKTRPHIPQRLEIT